MNIRGDPHALHTSGISSFSDSPNIVIVRYLGGGKVHVAVGDNFLSIIVPKIMDSKAYKDNGVTGDIR